MKQERSLWRRTRPGSSSTCLLATARSLTLKWVFKLKDEKGSVIKHKARLVARGFVQQEGIDYDDAFAPVARMESVRVLLALAAGGWSVHHMDVKSAFLNGDLKEEVYVRQPLGFVVAGEGKVYRLLKALYGLRQALRAWNAKLDATLKAMGFTQSVHEAVVYRRRSGRSVLLVGVYVDYLIITGAEEEEVKSFKVQMRHERPWLALLLPRRRGASGCQWHHPPPDSLRQADPRAR